jgi:catechol 2,3-dioxygenase-like lactoylglutathione lyase family enzyme
MILGAHVIVYSRDADADRALLRDVLGFPHVDAGGGWLIFGLPGAEAAVHPAEENGRHELYLMCDDVAAQVAALRARGVECSDPMDRGWGILATLTLPGGGELGIYQPRHPVAIGLAAKAKRTVARKKPARKPAPKPRAAKRASSRAPAPAARRPRGSRPPAKRR